MKALKIPILILLLSLPPGFAIAGQTGSENTTTDGADTAQQENADSGDQGGDRGFDPCLLNPSLAVCINKQ